LPDFTLCLRDPSNPYNTMKISIDMLDKLVSENVFIRITSDKMPDDNSTPSAKTEEVKESSDSALFKRRSAYVLAAMKAENDSWSALQAVIKETHHKIADEHAPSVALVKGWIKRVQKHGDINVLANWNFSLN